MVTQCVHLVLVCMNEKQTKKAQKGALWIIQSDFINDK